MSCPCDEIVHPPLLWIPAGRTHLPRQIADFAEFRASMLQSIRDHDVLNEWDARAPGDLGVMILEMFAYALTTVAFADETLAHEAYLRTARRRPSLRKLVGLLGYQPRPAVAGSAFLAAVAEGRRPVLVPRGTAFGSSAFGDEPPQTFELDEATAIHVLTNRWSVEAAAAGALPAAGYTEFLLDTASANANADDRLLVRIGSADLGTVHQVQGIDDFTGDDGERYKKIRFAPSVVVPANTTAASIALARTTQTAGLWTLNSGASVNSNSVDLDGLYRQIRPAARVLLARGSAISAYQVASVSEVQKLVSAADTITVETDDGDRNVSVPAIHVPVTRLVLDRVVASDVQGSPNQITLHYGMDKVGEVQQQPSDALDPGTPPAPLVLAGRPEVPVDTIEPERFLLRDRDDRGLLVEGRMEWPARRISLDSATQWAPPLRLPVEIHGNVLSISRGETVDREVLGDGDASQVHQSFPLKKNPLTYLAKAGGEDSEDFVSTLRVWVDGIRWRRASSFFGLGATEEVYIERQNDDGETRVIFGDGINGARLPQGSENLVCSYRFGAGAATPPAGSITQIAKPAEGLSSVSQPSPAFGGADADGPAQLRESAPRSALMLGRAISIPDFEAVAASHPGVRAVHAEWAWNPDKLRALVQVWYIGEAMLAAGLRETLLARSDATTPVAATPAEAVATPISIEISVDPRFVADQVREDLKEVLLGARGMLTPEGIGIGKSLFRSKLLAAVCSVAGVDGVTGLDLGGQAFSNFAVHPGEGRYFDVETAGLEIHVVGGADG